MSTAAVKIRLPGGKLHKQNTGLRKTFRRPYSSLENHATYLHKINIIKKQNAPFRGGRQAVLNYVKVSFLLMPLAAGQLSTKSVPYFASELDSAAINSTAAYGFVDTMTHPFSGCVFLQQYPDLLYGNIIIDPVFILINNLIIGRFGKLKPRIGQPDAVDIIIHPLCQPFAV